MSYDLPTYLHQPIYLLILDFLTYLPIFILNV